MSAQPLFVRADSTFKTAQDVVAWAKVNPGKLNWSTASTNGGPHIATEAAFRHLGIQAQYIPYKGGADAILGLLSGQIDALVAAEFPPYASSDEVRLLGRERVGAHRGLSRRADLQGTRLAGRRADLLWARRARGCAVSDRLALGGARPRNADHAGLRRLMGRRSASASFKDSAALTSSIVTSYREMGVLIPQLGLKQP